MHFPSTRGLWGLLETAYNLRKKIIQTVKPKKIRSKPKTARKAVKFDIFHVLVIKILISAIYTVVTREHTEVIRDQWKRIVAAQIEERQVKPEPKEEKT